MIQVCSAAEKNEWACHILILSLLPELGFVQPSNQPVQETDLGPKLKINNIQLNQLPDEAGCRAQCATVVPAQGGEYASLQTGNKKARSALNQSDHETALQV